MAYVHPAFYAVRIKIVTDHLDRFPDSGNMTIARIIYRDFPEYFNSIENARKVIRYYRGANGAWSRHHLKDKKYVKQIQPS